MKKIDKRCLSLSPYEYLQYCHNKRRVRGAAVITTKQCIFYSQLLQDDQRDHNNILNDIENEIHTDTSNNGWNTYRENHAFMVLSGEELVISMPDNGKLSISQARFILNILDQVNKYIQETRQKIKLDFFEAKGYKDFYGITDTKGIKMIKERLKKRVTKDITIEKEKIIGTTLTKEEIKKELTEIAQSGLINPDNQELTTTVSSSPKRHH